jgi:hypothetical protein
MGQCDPLHLRELPEVHCVLDRAMPPADLGRILFGSVLRVVDEKVRTIDEFGVSQIFPGDLPMAGCQHARVRFVVTGITSATPSASNR